MKNTLQDKDIKRFQNTLSPADVNTLKLFNQLTKYDVRDKVILITGGSRGLGFELAKQLAQRGAKIALCARSSDQLGQAQVELEQMGAQVATFVADVTNPDQVQELFREVLRHYYGQLDVLVNNAGITRPSSKEALDVKAFEHIMKTNFWASLYTTFAAIPVFQKLGRGRIVNITSHEHVPGSSQTLPYTASNFALMGVSGELSASLKEHNINVTTVTTGNTLSANYSNSMNNRHYPGFKTEDETSSFPISSLTPVQQIVHALEYGLSEVTIKNKTVRKEAGSRPMLPLRLNALFNWAIF